LFAFTLNGFPYGNFHAHVVKHAVYEPDWTTDARSAYTLELARVLAKLLPAGLETGTISTLPIAHRRRADAAIEATAARQLCRLAEQLARLRDRTGKSIVVCLEPEPGCVLERTTDAIRWFGEILPQTAARAGFSQQATFHQLALCFDTCHHAVAFEEAAEALAALRRAMVPIGKVQLSSAVVVAEPGSPAARAALRELDEPRFLHQVRALRADGSLAEADDLAAIGALPTDREWRVHFHVPIHRAVLGPVTTTRPFVEAAAEALVQAGEPPHLEVETYTWSVLPPAERPRTDIELVRGIAEELSFARSLVS
jgi:hypothetical protein